MSYKGGIPSSVYTITSMTKGGKTVVGTNTDMLCIPHKFEHYAQTKQTKITIHSKIYL